MGDIAQSLPTRLTMLPLQLAGARGLRRNRINFISLTPGTTFELQSFTGKAEERALILRILSREIGSQAGRHRLFQVTSGDAGWARARSDVDRQEIDEEIAARFTLEARARLIDTAPLPALIPAHRTRLAWHRQHVFQP